MPETSETLVPQTEEQFPLLSRWFDMLDEALEIGTHRKK